MILFNLVKEWSAPQRLADKENFWGAFFMGKEGFETLFLDKFENPLRTTNSKVKLDAGGTNYLTVVTDRLYDDNQKLIKEVTTGTYSKDNKSIVSHT